MTGRCSSSRYETIRRRTFEVLERGEEGDVWSRRFDVFILLLIVVNVMALVLETVAELRGLAGRFFAWLAVGETPLHEKAVPPSCLVSLRRSLANVPCGR